MTVIYNEARKRYEDYIPADFLRFYCEVRLPGRWQEPTVLTTEQMGWLEKRGLVEASPGHMGGGVWVYRGVVHFLDQETAALFKLFFV